MLTWEGRNSSLSLVSNGEKEFFGSLPWCMPPTFMTFTVAGVLMTMVSPFLLLFDRLRVEASASHKEGSRSSANTLPSCRSPFPAYHYPYACISGISPHVTSILPLCLYSPEANLTPTYGLFEAAKLK